MYYDEAQSSTFHTSNAPGFSIQYGIGQIQCSRVIDTVGIANTFLSMCIPFRDSD